MKRLLNFVVSLIVSLLVLTSCMSHDLPEDKQVTKEQIDTNVKNIFGTSFDKDHDWNVTTSGKVTVSGIPADAVRVCLMSYVEEEDGSTSMKILNQEDIINASSIILSYDIQKDNLGMFACLYLKDGSTSIKRVKDDRVAFNDPAGTRGEIVLPTTKIVLPETELKITSSEPSYAATRGWIPGETLYSMADYESQKISVSDYKDDYKDAFRAVIFSYFKNGRAYNNLPLVQASGFYNETAYPFTTGKDPIIVSPVYKNDGGYKEVENSDLYYYYFKDSDLGQDPRSYLESLPKYKAIQLNQCIKADDEICKHTSYALVYWGDGVPTDETEGSYTFPEGYKIGFMIRAKTTAEGGKKQGELYGDGRLNNYINSYDKCNFKSSKLGVDAPRQAWIYVGGRYLLTFESGTDADFNDIVFELEGGIVPPKYIPELEDNFYTYCFEDTELGDYDLNDVVIRARRINSTKVEYSLVACGALDELYVKNISGNTVNWNTEVHTLLGASEIGFINTLRGQAYSACTDVVTVDKGFSFLDPSTQPYVYDVKTGIEIKIAKKGEDPHGIMIPYAFKWSLEKVCVKDAYKQFNNWGSNRVTSTDWYKYPETDRVF